MDVRITGFYGGGVQSRLAGNSGVEDGKKTAEDRFAAQDGRFSFMQMVERMARAAKERLTGGGRSQGGSSAGAGVDSGGKAGAGDGVDPGAPTGQVSTTEDSPMIRECVRAMGREVRDDGSRVPMSEEVVLAVARTLKLYKPDDLKSLREKGVVIYVVDNHVTPGGEGYPGMKPGENWPKNVGAFYHPSCKLMVVPREYMTYTGVVTHELGHAIDDAMEPDRNGRLWYSESSPEGMKIFGDYLTRVKGDPSRQWNGPNVAPNVVEYFAEGLRVYHSSLPERATLQRLDSAMFSFVEASMGRFRSR